MCENRITEGGILPFQTLLHQTSKRGNGLRKGRDKAVGQGELHSFQQPVPGLVVASETMAGHGAGHSQINICRRETLGLCGQGQSGLRHGQHGVILM
ncbi:hypothetical protein SDC9_196191 [bioreactor metagenome]|uniref:Uncharacterized protein n=1 Tax=bioreactor metagenome TaxID=1076179 RepID=A0A645IB66_9ZZZZ